VLSYGATRSLSQSAASAAELSELSGVTAAPWLSAPWSLHPPKKICQLLRPSSQSREVVIRLLVSPPKTNRTPSMIDKEE